MGIESRLIRLESVTAQFPPDGAALLREADRLPELQVAAWMTARTDAELQAIIEAHNGGGIRWSLVTDAELEQMCAGSFDFENLRLELVRQNSETP